MRRAPPSKGGPQAQALSRSRGGFSTKIHVNVDRNGHPLRFMLTRRGESRHHAGGRLDRRIRGCVCDSRQGYDADKFVRCVGVKGMRTVIPPRATRKHLRACDTCLYRERNLGARFMDKLKPCRRIFSRFDKLASRYLGFLHFIAALIRLRWNVNTT